MKPHPKSPNALWKKHGFTIERKPRKNSSGFIRTVRNPDGEVILVDAGYDEEMRWIRQHLEATA